jgi:hypothetical protein
MRITRRRVLIYLAVLIVVPSLIAGYLLIAHPLQPADRGEAAALIVAWALEGKPLPGSDESMEETRSFRKAERIILICDWVPRDQLPAHEWVTVLSEREARSRLDADGLYAPHLFLQQTSSDRFQLTVRVLPRLHRGEGFFYDVSVTRRHWGLHFHVERKLIP